MDLGRGMYRRSWGCDFNEGSGIILHPDGMRIHQVPSFLTCASPSDTYTGSAGAFRSYFGPEGHVMKQTAAQASRSRSSRNSSPNGRRGSASGEHPQARHFAIHTWFCWDPERLCEGASEGTVTNHLLLQSSAGASSVQQSVQGGSGTSAVVKFIVTREANRAGFLASMVGQGTSGTSAEPFLLRLQIALRDANKEEHLIDVPTLTTGWHRLAIVSNTPEALPSPAYNGVAVYVDDWKSQLPKQTFLDSDFYYLGNESGGHEPFGCLADFRIYARPLRDTELELLLQRPVFGRNPAIQSEDHGSASSAPEESNALLTASKSIVSRSTRAATGYDLDPPKGIPADTPDANYFPDQIVRCIVENNGVAVCASRLDIADTATECLRLLGTLATLQEARSEIFGICGPRLLQLRESPLPMIRRQAARLLQNLK
ncbi:unnamed protein product [Amoebophrya sp. A25]|nr:unnamed protein product [Amoebophrya sp. A25]|eukprot:GSA25T00020387001.1